MAVREDYGTCGVSVDGPVATVTITPPHRLEGGTSDLHWDLGEIFSELRGDNSLRVIVLTGSHGEFYRPREAAFYDNPELRRYVSDPEGAWKTFTGILRCHQQMCEIEKPIVARVPGPALGFGSSLVLACDLIVAVADALIVDIHMGMGETEEGGPAFGIVPGDGGGALAPLFFPPTLAKEFLMLGKRFTAQDLAELGIVNYAVPEAELDAKVDEIVQALLRRSSFALAWTKRIANRRIADQLNLALDASAAYEMVNFLQIDRLGGNDPRTLDGADS